MKRHSQATIPARQPVTQDELENAARRMSTAQTDIEAAVALLEMDALLDRWTTERDRATNQT